MYEDSYELLLKWYRDAQGKQKKEKGKTKSSKMAELVDEEQVLGKEEIVKKRNIVRNLLFKSDVNLAGVDLEII